MYEYKAKVTRVVDGDTIDADVDLGFYMVARIRFRLVGIDTPEIRGVERPDGLVSKEFVDQAIGGDTIIIRTAKAGKFGRWLATVLYDPGERSQDGEILWRNLNEELIAKGLAEPYK